MIQPETRLHVADNTGAKELMIMSDAVTSYRGLVSRIMSDAVTSYGSSTALLEVTS